ncbi:MAG: hypothetical protein J0M12_13450 [Deltaproteobacteria bacterium]|nr:hypothetical protein [Deltaproteobacteria bacterium]
MTLPIFLRSFLIATLLCASPALAASGMKAPAASVSESGQAVVTLVAPSDGYKLRKLRIFKKLGKKLVVFKTLQVRGGQLTFSIELPKGKFVFQSISRKAGKEKSSKQSKILNVDAQELEPAPIPSAEPTESPASPTPIPQNSSTETPTPIPTPALPTCSELVYNFDAPTATITGDDTITFHLAEPAPCGQFVDGSWWVLGPVRIKRITPDFATIIPSNAATYPAPMLQALQTYLNFRVGDPLCAHDSKDSNCITAEESAVLSDFYISWFNIPTSQKNIPTYRSGFALDPVADQNSFDSRFLYFQAPPALPQYSFDGELISGGPDPLLIAPSAGDAISIVKTVSRNDINYGTGWGACDKKTLVSDAGSQSLNRGCFSSSAILTVVSAVPPTDAFRPAYSGIPQKKLQLASSGAAYFRLSDLHLEHLPSLPTGPVSAQLPSYQNVLKSFGGTWTFLFNNGPGMSLQQPTSNIRSTGGGTPLHYHSSISNVINNAMLRTMHGDDDPEQRLKVIAQVVQRGLDYYYALYAGKHYISGTGFNLGFKSTILYSGRLLEHSSMLNVDKDFDEHPLTVYSPNGRPSGRYFAEDSQTYFGADTWNGSPIALWGNMNESTASMTSESVAATVDSYEDNLPISTLFDDLGTLPADGGFGGFPQYYLEPYVTKQCGYGGNRTVSDPKGQRDGGYWTSLNTTQRPIVGYANGQALYSCPRMARVVDVLNGTAPAGASDYQSCCSSAPMVGSYTVAMLMGLRSEWGHEPFFKYVERWASPPYSAVGNISGGYGDPYNAAMYWNYLYGK